MGDNKVHIITQNVENAELRERAIRIQLQLLEEAAENIREIAEGTQEWGTLDMTKVDALVNKLEVLGRDLSVDLTRVVTLTKMLDRSRHKEK